MGLRVLKHFLKKNHLFLLFSCTLPFIFSSSCLPFSLSSSLSSSSCLFSFLCFISLFILSLLLSCFFSLLVRVSSLLFHLHLVFSRLSSFIFSFLLFSCLVFSFLVLSLSLFLCLSPSLSSFSVSVCLCLCVSLCFCLSLSLCLSVSVSVWCCVVCCVVLCVVWCVARLGTQKKPRCVDSIRPRVYRHHEHMCYHMRAWCRYTRGRFESTHGGFWDGHTEERGERREWMRRSPSVLLTMRRPT